MNILAWRNDWAQRGDGTKDIYGGVGYYRINKPLQFLKQHTITTFGRLPVIVDDNLKKIPPTETIPYMIKNSDLVLMKNVSNLSGLMQFVGACEYYDKPLILDMDDDYFSVDQLSPNFSQFKLDTPEQSIHRVLFKSATAITVATEPLIDIYKPYNKNIHWLPNYNDINDWNFKPKKRKSGRIVIGWAGSSTHESDFMIIEEAMHKLIKKYGKKIIFSFCGAFPVDIFNDFPRWSFEIKAGTDDVWDYMPKLAEWGFDIGIAPLKKIAFNESKSEGKWFEYSMYKVPTVASNYGPYKRVITNGKDGLLANNTDDWINMISELIDNKEKRNEIGENAYNKIKMNHQWKDHAYQWEDVFNKYKHFK